MAILLDTNIFIAAERSRESGTLANLLDQLPDHHRDDEALISVISASELLMGVHRAPDPAIRQGRQDYVDALLDRFSTVSIDLRVARTHSAMVARLLKKGEPIGSHDSWIAATALSFDFALATMNVSEFRRVEGLSVIALRTQFAE